MTLVGYEALTTTSVIPAPRVRDSALAGTGRDPCTHSRTRSFSLARAISACQLETRGCGAARRRIPIAIFERQLAAPRRIFGLAPRFTITGDPGFAPGRRRGAPSL